MMKSHTTLRLSQTGQFLACVERINVNISKFLMLLPYMTFLKFLYHLQSYTGNYISIVRYVY